MPRLMTELVTWFGEATEQKRLHPPLVIAVYPNVSENARVCAKFCGVAERENLETHILSQNL
jgi:hypothetical protein